MVDWRKMVIKSVYFNLNHWLQQVDAENQQAKIYSKDSDEIIKHTKRKPSDDPNKVVNIMLTEKTGIESAIRQFKTGDEPPEKTVILLVYEAPDMILTTIQSRAQRVNIRPIEEKYISQILLLKYGLNDVDSQAIAHLSNGNLIKALEAIHLNEENKLFFELFVNLMRLSYKRKIKEMKLWSEQVAGMGREKQKSLLMYCQQVIRENFF